MGVTGRPLGGSWVIGTRAAGASDDQVPNQDRLAGRRGWSGRIEKRRCNMRMDCEWVVHSKQRSWRMSSSRNELFLVAKARVFGRTLRLYSSIGREGLCFVRTFRIRGSKTLQGCEPTFAFWPFRGKTEWHWSFLQKLSLIHI